MRLTHVEESKLARSTTCLMLGNPRTSPAGHRLVTRAAVLLRHPCSSGASHHGLPPLVVVNSVSMWELNMRFTLCRQIALK